MRARSEGGALADLRNPREPRDRRVVRTFRGNRRLVVCSTALAFVLSCGVVIGQGFAETLSFEGSFGNAGLTAATVVAIAGLTVVIGALVAALFRGIDSSLSSWGAGEGDGALAGGNCGEGSDREGGGDCEFDREGDDFGTHLRERLLRYFLLVFAAWLPVLFVHFPGTLTYDNYVQMMVSNGLTVAFSAHNPPFDTWLYGLFWSLGDALGHRSWGLAAYALCQTAFTAFGMAATLCWLRCLRVPRPLRAVLGAGLCLLPLFPLAAECMTKDFTFAAVFLPWCLMAAECLRSRGRLFDDRRMIVLYFVLTLVMMMAKKTGVYVAVPSAFVVFAALWRSDARRVASRARGLCGARPHEAGFVRDGALVCDRASRSGGVRFLITTLAAAFVYLVLFETLFYSAFGIVEGSDREMYSIPMQQTARCALEHPGDVTASEDAAIAAVFGEDWQTVLPSVYNPVISDPVKALYAPYATTNETLTYFGAWASLGLRHPVTYLESFFANTYECVWPGIWLQQELAIPAEWDTLGFSESLLIYAREGVTAEEVYAQVGGIGSSEALAGARQAYNDVTLLLAETPIVGLLFSKALYAFWIPAFVLAYALYRKSLIVFAAVTPALLCFLALLAGPVSQARYVTPELFVSVLLIGACWLARRDEGTRAVW